MLLAATMGYLNSPGFFQHRMEELLSSYLWKFVLVYIDDVIIFSKNLMDHARHLGFVLHLLESSGITLSISKCFFAYPSVQALGHRVSRLGLSTLEEKIQAVKSLLFPATLQELEHAIGFFGYYRKFVEFFASICEPLVIVKTKGLKGAPVKGRLREQYTKSKALVGYVTPEELEAAKKAFKELQHRLCTAPTLAFPDFSRGFILYVDGSRERGYGVAVHQLDTADPPVERPVLFLSKTLTAAEQRYWPTELETGALVWALQKLPHFTDHGEVTVHCDH